MRKTKAKLKNFGKFKICDFIFHIKLKFNFLLWSKKLESGKIDKIVVTQPEIICHMIWLISQSTHFTNQNQKGISVKKKLHQKELSRMSRNSINGYTTGANGRQKCLLVTKKIIEATFFCKKNPKRCDFEVFINYKKVQLDPLLK